MGIVFRGRERGEVRLVSVQAVKKLHFSRGPITLTKVRSCKVRLTRLGGRAPRLGRQFLFL